jgi:hypothetical protein
MLAGLKVFYWAVASRQENVLYRPQMSYLAPAQHSPYVMNLKNGSFGKRVGHINQQVADQLGKERGTGRQTPSAWLRVLHQDQD